MMVAIKRFLPRIPPVLVAVVVTTLISWATGFEQNGTVTVSHIHAPRAQAWIRHFNDNLNTGMSLVARRAGKNRLHQEAASRGDRIAAINARRDVDLLEAELEQVQSRVVTLRRHLRSLLFEGVGGTGNALNLYPRGQIPAGLSGDGRTWRLLVGNTPLNPDRLPVTAGGDVIGRLPRGLPTFSVPRFDSFAFFHLLPYAVIIAFLGFMEAISIARAMAAKTGQRIDANQEFIGQGIANLVGSLSRSYPVSGSFSRSAVNLQAGAVTGLSSVFTSLTVVIVLLFLTPLLYYLPQCVLAAVIMMAVIGLINVKGFLHAWRAQWYDGAISIITFVCTLAFAPHLDRGIITGAALSLGVFLYKSMRPTVVDLSLGVDHALHDAVAYGLRECKYIDVVRFDGPLFFASASYLEDQIRERRLNKKELKHIIIAANAISDIDASGEEALSFTVDRVRRANIDISLCGVNEAVMKVLKRTHLLDKIGEDHIFPNIEDAIRAIHAGPPRGGDEHDCPLKVVVLRKDNDRERTR
jgi:anti-anti-sigma factor